MHYLLCVSVCLCVCVFALQFVGSTRCQHSLKKVITCPGYVEHNTGTSEECTNLCESLGRYLWYGPKRDRFCSVLWFLIQVIFWIAVHSIILLVTVPVFLVLQMTRLCCSSGPTPKGWQQELLNKFEHPYYKFLNHTLFYVAFLALVFASAFENKFHHTVFLGLSILRKLIHSFQGGVYFKRELYI